METLLTPQEMWERDKGDEIKIIDYPLDSTSQVIELGGFTGVWSKKIIDKFNPNLIIVEPIPQFVNELKHNFGNNSKVNIEGVAISTSNKTINLYVKGCATSETNVVSNRVVSVESYDINYFISKYNLSKIDLIQINIECEEYPLIMNWIETGFLKNVKYIQVQFHTFCENYEEKYESIFQGLKEIGFEINYKYDFVWESWVNKNI
jgi:FkbM family methyltransferase